MSCIRYRTAISAYTEGAPPPVGVTRQDVDTHLTSCLACRRWSTRLRALRAATDDLLRHRRSGTPNKPV